MTVLKNPNVFEQTVSLHTIGVCVHVRVNKNSNTEQQKKHKVALENRIKIRCKPQEENKRDVGYNLIPSSASLILTESDPWQVHRMHMRDVWGCCGRVG